MNFDFNIQGAAGASEEICSKSHSGWSYLNAEVCISEWIALLQNGDVNAREIVQGFSQLDKIESGSSGYCILKACC